MKRSSRLLKSWRGLISFLRPSKMLKKPCISFSARRQYPVLKTLKAIEHASSAVEYQTYYEVDFILTDDRFFEMEMALIKELQTMFETL
jgi:hypothetical protein